MRLEGWEGRLAAALEAVRARPYRIGESDCFRLACAVLEALTGTQRWPEFAGRYRTKGQARRLLWQHGGSFDAAFSWFFGADPVPGAQARRGDVVKFVDERGEAHLGVCVGADVAVYGEAGLVFVPRRSCGHAWRVG